MLDIYENTTARSENHGTPNNPNHGENQGPLEILGLVESKTTEELVVDTGHMEEGTEESSEESWDAEEEEVVAGEQQQQQLMRTNEHLFDSHNNSYIISSLDNNLSDINSPNSNMEEEWISSSFNVDRLISIIQNSPLTTIARLADKRLVEIYEHYQSQCKKIRQLNGRNSLHRKRRKNLKEVIVMEHNLKRREDVK
jgi:hypothetical protein